MIIKLYFIVQLQILRLNIIFYCTTSNFKIKYRTVHYKFREVHIH